MKRIADALNMSVWSIIAVIIFFFLATSLLGFWTTIRPRKILSTQTPADYGLSYQDVTLTTADHVRLRGWFVPRRDSDGSPGPTMVLLHGYPADRGDILPATSFLAERYHLLYFDFRGLGQSQRVSSTIGGREVGDLQAALAYLRDRGITEIGLWGFSMGGAVALMTAPNYTEVKVVVSDSSYARLDLMTGELYRYPGLRHVLGWLTNEWARLFLRVNPAAVAPMESAKRLSIPVLLIHSRQDEVIPFRHAQLIQAGLQSNPQAEFWFTDQLHGAMDAGYRQRLETWLAQYL